MHPLIEKEGIAAELLPPREPNNVYPTHPDAVRACVNLIFDAWLTTPGTLHERTTFLDPGSGDGIWGKVAKEVWMKNFPFETTIDVIGYEIRDLPVPDDYDTVIRESIFNNLSWFEHDKLIGNETIVIGNPPYHENWREMVRWIAATVDEYPFVALLLPTDWRHGENRMRNLYAEHMPMYIFDSARRIPFTGDSNPRNFALYFWWSGWKKPYYMGLPFDYKFPDAFKELPALGWDDVEAI